MAIGTVKWFSGQKGYGFIQQQDGQDIFVHHSDIDGFRGLIEGQEVRFEIETGQKGPKAKDVTIINE